MEKFENEKREKGKGFERLVFISISLLSATAKIHVMPGHDIAMSPIFPKDIVTHSILALLISKLERKLIRTITYTRIAELVFKSDFMGLIGLG